MRLTMLALSCLVLSVLMQDPRPNVPERMNLVSTKASHGTPASSVKTKETRYSDTTQSLGNYSNYR